MNCEASCHDFMHEQDLSYWSYRDLCRLVRPFCFVLLTADGIGKGWGSQSRVAADDWDELSREFWECWCVVVLGVAGFGE